MNLTSLLSHLAQTQTGHPAIVTRWGEIDYQTFDAQVNFISQWLLARGMRSGKRIALMVGDEILLATLIFACARIGVTFICIPRSYTPSQRNALADLAQIDYLIKDQREVSISEVSSFYLDVTIWSSFDPSSGQNSPININEAPDLLMIVIGSGSTGKSKLIPLEHQQMHARVSVLTEVYEFKSTDRTGTMAHLEYTAAITRLFACLTHGSSFVILDRESFDLASVKKTYGITRLSATVFHVENMLLEAQNFAEPPLAGVQLSVTSSPVSDHLRQRVLEKLTQHFWVVYGTNEVWTATVAKPNQILTHQRTIGTAVSGVSIKIVDDHFNTLPPNTVGHICIQSRGSIDHYLNADESDDWVFKEGWFIPKDMGMLTSDGHLIFYGRSDNMMIFNGINIYPAEIENCLADHECVLDVVAIPWSDPMHHQIPVAIVSLSSPINEDELMRFCEKILGFRTPQRIFIVPKLHRNKQGKITQETLAQLIREIGDQP
jgi:cyanophycin synthetase